MTPLKSNISWQDIFATDAEHDLYYSMNRYVGWKRKKTIPTASTCFLSSIQRKPSVERHNYTRL